jgi:nucleoside-triphosphatase THEP1
MPECADIGNAEKHGVIEFCTEGLFRMTMQPDQIQRDRNAIPEIPKVPWSQLGPEFVTIWGRADPNDPQPEHMEIVGMNGSGKTYFLMVILQMLMLIRDSRIILVVTKQSDKVFMKLGWPIVTEFKDLKKHKQCIYWPKTKELGDKRDEFQELRLYELLTRLWKEDANIFIAFDEIARIESLSPRVKQLVGMYWREARSMGITIIAMKQRPQGVQRDMHSETYWTITFKPKDEDDGQRFAELLGNRKQWQMVFEQMDADNHEFVIKHTRTGIAYISWVDFELQPIEPPSEQNRLFR